jgi:hypothetical protein
MDFKDVIKQISEILQAEDILTGESEISDWLKTLEDIEHSDREIQDIDVIEIEKTLLYLVYYLFVITGQTPNKDFVIIYAKVLAKDLKMNYRKFTFADVKIAFDSGIRGDEGKSAINIITMNKWLRKHKSYDIEKFFCSDEYKF